MNEPGKKKVRFINPPNRLREKVGYGGLPMDVLETAQAHIENNELDFTPYIDSILKKMDGLIRSVEDGTLQGKDAVKEMAAPVMELKANGAMFKYDLISDVADVVLNFLENVSEINQDGLEIIHAHQKTLEVILSYRLTGVGGKMGQTLARELFSACQRYYKKYGINPQGIAA